MASVATSSGNAEGLDSPISRRTVSTFAATSRRLRTMKTSRLQKEVETHQRERHADRDGVEDEHDPRRGSDVRRHRRSRGRSVAARGLRIEEGTDEEEAHQRRRHPPDAEQELVRDLSHPWRRIRAKLVLRRLLRADRTILEGS
jgi:hypothetical protein